jgi:hypothetical protein
MAYEFEFCQIRNYSKQSLNMVIKSKLEVRVRVQMGLGASMVLVVKPLVKKPSS